MKFLKPNMCKKNAVHIFNNENLLAPLGDNYFSLNFFQLSSGINYIFNIRL